MSTQRVHLACHKAASFKFGIKRSPLSSVGTISFNLGIKTTPVFVSPFGTIMALLHPLLFASIIFLASGLELEDIANVKHGSE